MTGQIGPRRGKPRQHGLPVLDRHGSLREGLGERGAQRLAHGCRQAVADQGDDAGARSANIQHGMECGPQARAAGQGGGQRGIEQEGPVVIDADQHGLMTQLERRDMNGARHPLACFRPKRQGQCRQLVRTGTQDVVGHGAGIERVEKTGQAGIGRQQMARLCQLVLGPFRRFSLGGTDGGHHAHGWPRLKRKRN